MRPWSCWKPSGRPLASSATISPSRQQRRLEAARQRLERPDDGGELAVLSLPFRDQRPDVGPRLAGRDVDQRADAVVLRLVDQPALVSGGSASDASIGRTFAGSSRQAGIEIDVNSKLGWPLERLGVPWELGLSLEFGR